MRAISSKSSRAAPVRRASGRPRSVASERLSKGFSSGPNVGLISELRLQIRPHDLGATLARVVGPDAEDATAALDPRRERRRLQVLEAGGARHPHRRRTLPTAPRRAGASCRRRPRLRRGPSAPRRDGPAPRLREQVELLAATEQPALPSPRLEAAVDVRSRRGSSSSSTQTATGCSLPLTLMGGSSRAHKVVAHVVQQVAADKRPVGLGGGHQPRRQIDRVAHDRVLAAERRSDLAGEDVAAVHPDLVLQVQTRRRAAGVQIEREAGGVGRGVLVGHRRPEGDDELGSLRGDVAADDEAVVLRGEPR